MTMLREVRQAEKLRGVVTEKHSLVLVMEDKGGNSFNKRQSGGGGVWY